MSGRMVEIMVARPGGRGGLKIGYIQNWKMMTIGFSWYPRFRPHVGYSSIHVAEIQADTWLSGWSINIACIDICGKREDVPNRLIRITTTPEITDPYILTIFQEKQVRKVCLTVSQRGCLSVAIFYTQMGCPISVSSHQLWDIWIGGFLKWRYP